MKATCIRNLHSQGNLLCLLAMRKKSLRNITVLTSAWRRIGGQRCMKYAYPIVLSKEILEHSTRWRQIVALLVGNKTAPLSRVSSAERILLISLQYVSGRSKSRTQCPGIVMARWKFSGDYLAMMVGCPSISLCVGKRRRFALCYCDVVMA